MQGQDARGGGGSVALGRIEKDELGVAGLHQDGGVALRAAGFAGREIAQHQPTEAPLKDPHEPPHGGQDTSAGV